MNASPVLMFPSNTWLIILVVQNLLVDYRRRLLTLCMCVCMQGGVPHEAYAACSVCSLVSGRQVYSLGI